MSTNVPSSSPADTHVSFVTYRKAAVLYWEAQRCLDTGDLETCRDDVERALLIFLNAPAESSTDDDGHDSETQSTPESQGQQQIATPLAVDTLFANLLVLLSQVYSAAWAYHEADRLLATAAGYIMERLTEPSLALAAVLYNRAVLRLEQHRLSASEDLALVSEAQTRYLEPAAAYLVDVVGPGRLLLSDVLHSLGVCCVLTGEWATALQHFQRSLDVRVRSYNALERELRSSPSPRASASATMGASGGADACASPMRPLLPRKDTTELKLALTLEHVAQLYRLMSSDNGAQQNGLRCFTRALETRRRWLGPRHPLVLDTAMALAALATEMGEDGRARAAWLEVLDGAAHDDRERRDAAVLALSHIS